MSNVMKWQQEIDIEFNSDNWRRNLDRMLAAIKENNEDVDAHIQAMYLMHDVLQEIGCDKEEEEVLIKELLRMFKQASIRFSNVASYQFFMGKRAHIAEWHFGQDDVELALEMEKRAVELEPDNLIYRWGLAVTMSEKEEAIRLAGMILADEKQMEWLRGQGEPGRYMVNFLNSTSRIW